MAYFGDLSRPGVKNRIYDRMHWCGLPVWQLLFSDVEPVTSVITGEQEEEFPDLGQVVAAQFEDCVKEVLTNGHLPCRRVRVVPGAAQLKIRTEKMIRLKLDIMVESITKGIQIVTPPLSLLLAERKSKHFS